MNTFLLIDTATPAVSVALACGEEVLFSAVEVAPEGGASARAGVLAEKAVKMLREKGLKLDAVGISAGPGSYTGLRIGSSLAKGLCHGFNVPLIAVSALALMAVISSVPNTTNSKNSPIAKNTSPTRVTVNAFIAARPLARF